MANIKRMPIGMFVAELKAALARGDGYIMGATGQDPSKWSESSWWFTQYSGKQREKALYWRKHAKRVWDCNGLAEGIYKDYSGVDINTYARKNYAEWCGVKGAGLIPADKRIPGAAVFWGDSAGSIHHVGYLVEPVVPGNPKGDWYIVEARGGNFGVVRTRLNSRKPNFWGYMDKYFDYSAAASPSAADSATEGQSGAGFQRTLKKGMSGEDVKGLQSALLRLGYALPKYGADGDFGAETEAAVKAFQRDRGLEPDGVFGEKSYAALVEGKPEAQKPVEAALKQVKVTGELVNVRSAPGTSARILGVVKKGATLLYQGQEAQVNGTPWYLVEYDGQNAWISGKYSEVQ